MLRIVVVACVLAGSAVPLAAQELRLEPPALRAHANRCSDRQRVVCDGLGRQAAIDASLACDACTTRPLPPEIVAPAPKTNVAPTTAPRLDNIPRP